MSANETAEVVLLVIKRLAKWLVIALIAALTLVVVFVFAWPELSRMYSERARVVTELGGIKLGDKLSDTLFKNPGFELKKSKLDAPRYYANKDESMGFFGPDGRVNEVVYTCEANIYTTVIHGLSCESKGEAVLKKYGNDVVVWCKSDKTAKDYMTYRLYAVQKFGIRFHLISNKVEVFHATDRPVESSSWSACE
jgi:hypothetical protein